MPLRDEDIQRIGDYVKPWLRQLVESALPRPVPAGIDVQLLERMVRVEEELQSQRELMNERFGAMDRRFEAVDKRFEVSDTRFGDLVGATNARFGDMQAGIRSTQWLIGIGFLLITAAVTVSGFLA